MPRPVAELLQERFGTKAVSKTNPMNAASIGTAATQILQNNPNRFQATFVNLSAVSIVVWVDPQVTTARGILCGPGGGGFSFSWEEDFELCSSQLWAIAASAGAAFHVYEVISSEA